MKKNAFLPVVLSLIALLFAQLACALGGPPAIGEVVSAKSLDASYKPVNPTDTYGTAETFQISVEVQNIVVGNKLDVKYSVDGTEYYTSTLTADEDGTGYYGFSLEPSSMGHTPGTYTVEVYLDSELAKTITFKVEADGPPTIDEVFTAKTVNADNQPEDRTATFEATDVIVVSAHGKNMMPGDKVELKITYGDQTIGDEFVVEQFGNQYFTLTYDPGAGHPSGDYTLEAFLNGESAGKATFTVK